jgi:hypothetical protein
MISQACAHQNPSPLPVKARAGQQAIPPPEPPTVPVAPPLTPVPAPAAAESAGVPATAVTLASSSAAWINPCTGPYPSLRTWGTLKWVHSTADTAAAKVPASTRAAQHAVAHSKNDNSFASDKPLGDREVSGVHTVSTMLPALPWRLPHMLTNCLTSRHHLHTRQRCNMDAIPTSLHIFRHQL